MFRIKWICFFKVNVWNVWFYFCNCVCRFILVFINFSLLFLYLWKLRIWLISFNRIFIFLCIIFNKDCCLEVKFLFFKSCFIGLVIKVSGVWKLWEIFVKKISLVWVVFFNCLERLISWLCCFFNCFFWWDNFMFIWFFV